MRSVVVMGLLIGWVSLGLLYPAEASAESTPSVRDIVEGEARNEALRKEAEARGDLAQPDHRSPRSTIVTLSVDLTAGDFDAAAKVMDMRFLPAGIRPEDGPKLIKQLRYIFNRHIWIDAGALSDVPEGNLDDGLPPDREGFGVLETAKGPVELTLQRVPTDSGALEWKISSGTVALIPGLWSEFGHSELAGALADRLPNFRWFGIDNWQWAYLLAFILLLALLFFTARWLLRWSGLANRWLASLDIRLTGPIGAFMVITAVRLFMLNLGLSVKARAIFDSVLLVYLANIFLALGVIELLARRSRRRMALAGATEATVIVRPIAAVSKMVAVALLVVMGLDNAGYDVTTIIAGLGVSSIAVALAAQKTLENLIGAITLYIARPIKPGDFCRFDDKVGTVEEIGLRSTLLRTLDRTIINIPNGTLSAGQIENISRRDAIRFYRWFALRLSTTPDQLRYILASLRELLYAHPSILSDTVSVRLSDITEQAFMLRLDSRVNTSDFQQFLAVAEDINLRIVDLVHAAGTNFAYPSQTIMLEEPSRLDADQRERVEQLVARWRDEDRYPFPQWSDEHVRAIENTLDFPPRGSVNRPRNREAGDENER